MKKSILFAVSLILFINCRSQEEESYQSPSALNGISSACGGRDTIYGTVSVRGKGELQAYAVYLLSAGSIYTGDLLASTTIHKRLYQVYIDGKYVSPKEYNRKGYYFRRK